MEGGSTPRKYSSIPSVSEVREMDGLDNGSINKDTLVQVLPNTHEQVTKEEDEGWLRRYLEVFAAEVLGTTLLICLGCMSGIYGINVDAPKVPGAQGAAAWGIVVATIIQMIGHVSGAHLNPCVSMCTWILGQITLPMLLNYFIAEAVGSLLGFWLLLGLTPDSVLREQAGLCCTVPREEVSTVQALGIEFIATGILVFLVCSCTDPVNASKQDSVPMKFGFYIAGISFITGPYTGASLNPTRSLAPALMTGVWTQHWVYWVGPLTASAVVPLVYQTIFLKGVVSPNPSESKTK